MFKFDVVLDQHDIFGLVVIIVGFLFLGMKWMDSVTFLATLGIASGFILGSNTNLLSGKIGATNDPKV